MNICDACQSKEIHVETLSLEDLHNIINVFTCQKCGHSVSELKNLIDEKDV